MHDFVALTDRAGKPVFVNLGLVEYMSTHRMGAVLTFTRLPGLGTDRLAVRETPEEIVRRSNHPTI